jgi:hypothetical protein
VYQFYFWCQRNYVLEPRELRLRIDLPAGAALGWLTHAGFGKLV